VREIPLVAVVDDDESARRAIHGVLKSAGFNVASFVSGEEFLASDDVKRCACVITDLKMIGMNGFELQERLAESRPSTAVIFVSAHGDDRTRAQAIKAGALKFLDKPFDDDVLIEVVRSALAE